MSTREECIQGLPLRHVFTDPSSGLCVAGSDFITHFTKSQHYLLPFEKPREAIEGDQAPSHIFIPK